MPTFALVTEGITDQLVIERVVRAYCKAASISVEDVVPLQPLRDKTDQSRQGEQGGWEKVIEYCSSAEELSQAVQLNDFLIIQIDTDCADHANFGVFVTENGVQKTVDRMISETVSMLISKMDDEFYAENKYRIIFAIAVHSLECWLLPLFETDRSRAFQTLNCDERLHRCLLRQDIHFQKDAHCYRSISSGLRKIDNVVAVAKGSESFQAFLSALESATTRLALGIPGPVVDDERDVGQAPTTPDPASPNKN